MGEPTKKMALGGIRSQICHSSNSESLNAKKRDSEFEE